MATLVEEQSIDSIPSLTPEEAKRRGIVDYFDKTKQEGAADERGTLRIRIDADKKPDEEGDIKEAKFVDDTQFVAPEKKDVSAVKTVDKEQSDAEKPKIKLEDRSKFVKKEPKVVQASMTKDILPSPKGLVTEGKAGLPEGTSLAKSAEEDIQEKRKASTFDTFLTKLQNKEDIPELSDDLRSKIYNVYSLYNNPALPKSKKKYETILKNAFTLSQRGKKEEGPDIAFARGVKVRPSADNSNAVLKSKQERYAEGRIEVAKIINGTFNKMNEKYPDLQMSRKDEIRVEQAIIDRVSTGNFFNTFVETMSETQRGLLLDLPTFAGEAFIAGNIAKDLLDSGQDFSQAWSNSAEAREKWAKSHKELFNYMGGELLSDQINNVIIEELKKQVGQPGGITQERFKELTEITDTSGKVIANREFLNREQADELLFESIDQLAKSERFFLIYLENILGMSTLAKQSGVIGKMAVKKLDKKVSKVEAQKPVGAYEGMSLRQKAKAMARDGEQISINDKYLNIGLGQEKVSNTLDRMKVAKNELIKERKKFAKGTLEYKKLTNEINTVRGKLFRNYTYSLGAYPIFREGFGISTPASISQFVVAEMLGTGDDATFDFYNAQALGAVAYALGGKYFAKGVFNVASGIGSIISGKAPTITGEMSKILAASGAMVGVPREFFVDGNIIKYENFLKGQGRTLDRKQRSAIQYVFKLAEKMSEENLDLVLDSVTEFSQIEKRIVNSLKDKKMQEKVKNSLQTTFASLTSLGWLKGVEKGASANVDIRDMTSLKNVDAIVDSQIQQEEALKLADRVINNMKETLLESGVDFSTNEDVGNIVRKLESTIRRTQGELIKDKVKAKNLVDDTLSAILKDERSVDFTSKEFNTLVSASLRLDMNIKPDLNRGQAIEKIAKRINEALLDRVKSINENKFDLNYKKNMNVLIEDMMEGRILKFYSAAKLGYKDFDEAMLAENKTVNVLPLLKSLYAKSEEFTTSKTSLGKYFTAQGKFLSGPLANTLRKSIKEMGVRTLRSKFSKSTIEKLLTLHRQPTVKNATGDTVENPKFISEDADELDLAMYYSDSEEDTLEAFLALPSEVMDLQAAFRNNAFKTNNPDLAREIKSFETEIDDLIRKSAGDLQNMQQDAKNIYRSNVFDRTRGNGPLTVYNKSKSDVIPLSTTKGEKEATDTRAVFAKETPSQLFDPLIKDIQSYIKNPTNQLEKSIIRHKSNIFTQLSDRKNFDEVFDLDDPDSKEAFDVIKEAINGSVYTDWGDSIVKSIENVSPRAKVILNNQKGGYNFDDMNIDKLNELTELTRVKVIKNGEPDTEPLIDFAKLISDQRDIVRQMKRHKVLQDQYARFKIKIDNRLKTAGSGIRDSLAIEQDFITRLKKIRKFTDSTQFFDNYVKNGDVSGIRQLKSDLMKLGAENLDIYEKQVDAAITKQVIEGLLSLGERKIVPDKFITKIDGNRSSVFAYEKPELILEALENPQTREVIDEVMSQDHIEDLSALMKYLRNTAGGRGEYLDAANPPSGFRRTAFTIQEALSRIYNLARGMVSPAYVGSEFAIRVSLNASMDMVKMAAGDPDAARVLKDVLLYPEQMDKVKLDEFRILMTDFVVTELARADARELPSYLEEKFFD